ncbi:MAG: DUF1573 domain-containing protein [Acidobacteria bacterium]|nr:DUF1573 domain-containing protein [Acidobacteriota bacterium]
MLGKHTLQPNEKTELKVTYSTEERPGLFEKEVTLTTNIPGQEKIEIFRIRGNVKEAPSARIAVTPRRVILDETERSTGKKQAFSITNEGTIPLVISRIRFRDDSNIFFDGADEGNLTIEPDQTETIEIQLDPDNEAEPSQKYILIECNARNAGASGYFLIVQYGKR